MWRLICNPQGYHSLIIYLTSCKYHTSKSLGPLHATVPATIDLPAPHPVNTSTRRTMSVSHISSLYVNHQYRPQSGFSQNRRTRQHCHQWFYYVKTKKQQQTKCYRQLGLKLRPLPFRFDAYPTELTWHLLMCLRILTEWNHVSPRSKWCTKHTV